MNRQTLQKWIKLEDSILNAARSRKFKVRARRRLRRYTPKYPLLEIALLSDVKDKRGKEFTITGTTIRRKALELFPTLYQEEDQFKASKGFLERFLRRNNLVERAVTGVKQKIPKDAPELCEQFLDSMIPISDEYDVLMDMDGTPMYFDLPANKTIDFEGVKSVKVTTTGHEKLRYTVLLTAGVHRVAEGEYRGFRLPPVVIFKNLVKPPKGNFPPGMVVLGSKGGSMTQSFMLSDYIPKILMKRPGGYFQSQSTLLILDAATCHNTEKVEEKMKQNKIDTKVIHGGLTPLIQYLDMLIVSSKGVCGRGGRNGWQMVLLNSLKEVRERKLLTK